ncbi:MAG: hypothetical protein JRI79_13665 [Deltaproteobacteria bacterium]|nr:hypothetical protein [Deltaproteobacteria bacterium]MBW1921668.1 hypothetical protein [Deltaproteobacteria bacterium]MBW1936227.1 hypothetical protein [Deltaproteobacteria bacterium]MBW1978993.1 hypothetical protein [Deltaproteobacteria bacterium]MBW2301372.1 hypothetical protein [Deltaproteobacteria bacterium]
MVIFAYQVNNVLRVYGEQLRQNRLPAKAKNEQGRSSDTINISAEGRRKAIIDKIASSIVDRITQYGPHTNIEKEVFKKLEDEYGGRLAVGKASPGDLLFKVIDEEGETVNSLSVEDSSFLRHKLEQITKETVNKNMI